MNAQGHPPLGQHGIIKSLLLEGQAAPSPWWWHCWLFVLLWMDSWRHETIVCKNWYKNNIKIRLSALLCAPHWGAPYQQLGWLPKLCNTMPAMIVCFAANSCLGCGYRLLARCARHTFDSKMPPINKETSKLIMHNGEIGIHLTSNVPASMKSDMYHSEIVATPATQILCCRWHANVVLKMMNTLFVFTIYHSFSNSPSASCPSCSCCTGLATEEGTYAAHEPLAQPPWTGRSQAWCWHSHWSCSGSTASGAVGIELLYSTYELMHIDVLGLLKYVQDVLLFLLSCIDGECSEKVKHHTIIKQLTQHSPWAFHWDTL